METAKASTGYLAQIDVKYQIEGLTPAQAARVQDAVAAAIERSLYAAINGAIVDVATVAYVNQTSRVTHREVIAHDVEELRPVSTDLRDELARVLADENGLPPTGAALDVLGTVITALQDRDLIWAEHSKPGTPSTRVYAGDVVGELISEFIEGAPEPEPDYTDRNTAIKAIREALKERSGRSWSVTGGRGTARGWITISAPPRRMEGMYMSAEDSAELMRLLGRDLAAAGRERIQQITVPDAGDFRQEYVARAQGREPEVIGQRYWD